MPAMMEQEVRRAVLRAAPNKAPDPVSDSWDTLMTIATGQNVGEIIYILDALDEFQHNDHMQLIKAVRDIYSTDIKRHNLKFLITSRPYDHICRGFHNLEA